MCVIITDNKFLCTLYEKTRRRRKKPVYSKLAYLGSPVVGAVNKLLKGEGIFVFLNLYISIHLKVSTCELYF